MSWSDFGFNASWSYAWLYLLITCLIGYIIANRIAVLRPYRRIIVMLGVVALLFGVYEGRDDLIAGAKAGLGLPDARR
ncbi:MAG TPA: hypothetical protein VHX14_23675 [Thermoanaerobaculia bacterium]|jgi:hypothetical protein|nr:hypothetical protein [Thermoanaerobaculia bacterium]